MANGQATATARVNELHPHLGGGLPVEWVTQPDGTKELAGGTKMYLRTDPPQNDALAYGPSESKQFLGYFVARLSVPRWMATRFPDAIDQKEELDNYSQDWMENIYYVQTESETQPTDAEVKAINTLVAASPVLSHNLSTGCAQVTPRTTLQPLKVANDGTLSVQPAVADPHYALASGHLNGDITKITEWAVASIADRPKFEASALHATVLKEVISARDRLSTTPQLVTDRQQLLEVVTNDLPQGFEA